MNFKTIGVVISREYTTRVKKKSFLITTFVVPLLFAALCCVPALIMMFNKDNDKIIAVVDETGFGLSERLVSTTDLQFADCSNCNPDSLKSQLAELDYTAMLWLTSPDSTDVVANSYSLKPIGAASVDQIEGRLVDAVEAYRIDNQGIENLKEIISNIRPDIGVTTYIIDEDGGEKLSSTGVNTGLSMFLGIIIFMFVTMFSSSVMQSVIEEKQSKVVEVLLSSVRSLELMFGKIIGVAMVALTQFVLWIALTAALVSTVFGIVGKDKIMGTATDSVAQMTAPMGDVTAADAAIPGMDSLMASAEAGAQTDSTAVATAATQQPSGNMMQTIMQSVADLDIKLLLVSFFVFFVFGYLLYASIFAAIGSAVENAEDSSQLQMPVTVPLMIGYFIAIYSFNAPDSALAVWGSLIPFTSPIVMLARLPFGVPMWQLWLSVGLLVLTFALMAWLSAKIYRVGILTSGKKATWKDLWKWLRQK